MPNIHSTLTISILTVLFLAIFSMERNERKCRRGKRGFCRKVTMVSMEIHNTFNQTYVKQRLKFYKNFTYKILCLSFVVFIFTLANS